MKKVSDRVRKVLALLSREYSRAKTALTFEDPLEILVATILSAQCTDKRVNIVTEGLFKRYRTVRDYASADLRGFSREIRSTGFYRNKAKNIINAAAAIERDHNGKVPRTMKALISLPGVARKTANIVLYNGYGIVAGIAVDTHVKRLSGRLGWTDFTDPVKIEKDLMAAVPKKMWGRVNNILIDHGRAVCKAKKPLCVKCVVGRRCPSFGKV